MGGRKNAAHTCQMGVARRMSGRMSLILNAQRVWNSATSFDSNIHLSFLDNNPILPDASKELHRLTRHVTTPANNKQGAACGFAGHANAPFFLLLTWKSTAAVFCKWLWGTLRVKWSVRSAARHLRSTSASALGILPA
jgi:hypothetical protein